MNVLVIGANGKIGKMLVKLLVESGEHTPTAMIRKKEQQAVFENMGARTVVADLEGSTADLSSIMADMDAVVFTAGSGGHTGPDKTLLIDLDGAAKAIEAAGQKGVGRFLMVSAIGAEDRERWSDAIRPYYVAKHHADNILRASGLDYTIVRPGLLLDEPGTGRVSASEHLEPGGIPREDVAHAVFEALDKENTRNLSFDLVSGDTPVREAIEQL
ncbi:Nucleoside-diphosphate-sugar epimerase [Bhargavaea ginsengi]|uniref:Nucleoside-diphosphate-sugar epimerase n=1 Tax=Bhargavaea ginsengi TaxID=426757 RepID=A0A1H6SK87_9BACL|nr:SDR family oxidoreductase [Bhargavaea ginsengi]SEI67326.1 Nucleoside-diphosphate-sugar epimerase [Bhargavaea ginsengi]